jgi:protein phosphatase
VSLFGSKQPAITITVFGKTDKGMQRDHNEDRFLVADLTSQNSSLKPEVRRHDLGPKGSLLVVADGMGGAVAGEVASEMAIKYIYDQMATMWVDDRKNTPQQFAFRLREAIEAANSEIHKYSKEHPEYRGMGTTATTVGILENFLYLTQVGDSRAYLVRKGEATQLTKDQSLTQRLVDAGELTEEEAEKSERRNIILQALGPDAKVRVDLTHQEIRRGDTVVLCSDGLSGQVKKEEIAEMVTATEDLVEACGKLIDLANARGGPDNITVIVAKLDGDGLKDPGDGEEVGHQVYPLLDTESTTEPVPVYKPRESGGQTRMVIAALASALIMVVAMILAA